MEKVKLTQEQANEKQRRWWRKHGRNVWEIKAGDVLINNNNTPFVVMKIEDGRTHFQNKGWEYSGELKENWKVVCFTEDRKDIDHD